MRVNTGTACPER